MRLAGGVRTYDAVVLTAQVPVFQRMIPAAAEQYHAFLAQTEYLGIVCPLMVLDRPLTGYWTLNITDDRVPFTGVIETTAYIDPELRGRPSSRLSAKVHGARQRGAQPDDAIKAMWLENLRTMFPDFDERSVRFSRCTARRYVEPLHGLDSTDQIPAVQTPIDALFLVTTAQIYPDLTNGESVSRHAHAAAATIREALAARIATPVPV